MDILPGNYTHLNLGPAFVGGGAWVPLNLGVPWDVDPPEPVERGIRADWGLVWSGSSSVQKVTLLEWLQSSNERKSCSQPWRGLALSSSRSTALPWGLMPAAVKSSSVNWRLSGITSRAGLVSPWASLGIERAGASLAWGVQRQHRIGAQLNWQYGELSRSSRLLGWRSLLNRQTTATVLRWGHPGLERHAASLPWGPAAHVPWIVAPVVKPPEPPEPNPFPRGDLVALNLGCGVMSAAGLCPLNLGASACYAVRPWKGTYIVLNTVSVVRLPDRTPIEVESVSITGSAGAWGYDVDMTLADPRHLGLLKPAPTGRRQVEININGYVWTAVVESYSHRREFVRSGVTVTGRSRTALLAAPYAPSRALVSGSERSMAQLATDQLADTGYTLTWETIDWLVPAGAWFFDGLTPLDAVSALAEAAGAVVQSGPENRHLRVLPRYPLSPWDWPDSTPDHVVQDDIVVTESGQARSAPVFNAVVVTGELAGAGVTARVVRQGEAGDLYAPQASSPLITVAAAAAERGRNILSDRGDQDDIDLTLPMFAAPIADGATGRVLPMELVEVRSASGTWHGQCTASRVDARVSGNAITVEQTITLERHYTDAN